MNELEIQRLLVRLVGDATQYMRMLSTAKAKTQQTFNHIKTMGKSLSMYVTAPLAVFGGLSVKAFADFDSAMTQSASILTKSDYEKHLGSMRDLALELGTKGARGPRELAESYYFLTSAGLSAAASMESLETVMNFATAGNFDMARATDLLTDAQSALGLKGATVAEGARNMVHLGDVLVRGATLANASVEQFSEALTNTSAASLRAFNKPMEEGVALLAAYADQGVKGNVAGTQLSRVMLLLSKSVRENASAHKELGFSVFDADGKMRHFADIIQNLEEITGGMSDETKAMTLEQLGFQARVQQAILPLLGTSAAIREYDAELKKAGGTMQMVKDRQMKSFANQLKIVWNNITAMAISIGEILAPYVMRLAKALQTVTAWWKKLSDETKKVLVIFGLIVSAVGPLLLLFTALVTLGGFVATAFATVFSLLWTILPLLIPLGAILVAGGVALGLWVQHLGGISAAWQYVVMQINKAWEVMKPILKALRGIWDTVTDGVEQAWQFVSKVIKDAWDSVLGDTSVSWEQIRDIALTALIAIDFALQNLGTLADTVWAGIKLGLVKWISLQNYINTKLIPAGIEWILIHWPKVMEAVVTWGRKTFTTVAEDIMTALGNIAWEQAFDKMESAARRGFQKVIDGAKNVKANLAALLTGRTNLGDVWNPNREQGGGGGAPPPKKLFEAFNLEGVQFDAFEIPPRQRTMLEKRLQKEFDALTDKVGLDFGKFKAEKMAEYLAEMQAAGQQRQLKAGVQEAAKAGEMAGMAFQEGWRKVDPGQYERIEAVLSGSADALGRISEYRQNVLNGSSGGKTPEEEMVDEQKKANQFLGQIADNQAPKVADL